MIIKSNIRFIDKELKLINNTLSITVKLSQIRRILTILLLSISLAINIKG